MALGGERKGEDREGGKLRLIVKQVIYEGTGAPGPCQCKDRSAVTIAP